MKKTAIVAGAILGFLGVALGAFGAHALEDLLEANGYVDTYETGSRYHLIHSLFLVVLGILAGQGESRWLKIAIYATIIGIVIFAGSLYILSTLNIKWLGAVTPLGGLGFLTAWICLLIHTLSKKTS